MPVTVKGRKKESRRDGPNIQLCRSRLQIEASRRDESIRRTWRPIPRYGLDTGHGLVHPSYRAALDIRWGRQKFRPCALTSSQPTCGEFKTDFCQALHPGYHRPLTAIYGSERGVAPSALMAFASSPGRLRHQDRMTLTFSCRRRVGDFGSTIIVASFTYEVIALFRTST